MLWLLDKSHFQKNTNKSLYAFIKWGIFLSYQKQDEISPTIQKDGESKP